MMVLARLREFKTFNLPLLVGASRKRFIDTITPSPPQQRLGGSIAALAKGRHGARAALIGAALLFTAGTLLAGFAPAMAVLLV